MSDDMGIRTRDPKDVQATADMIVDVTPVDVSEITHAVTSGGDTIFTWDYTKGRYPGL